MNDTRSTNRGRLFPARIAVVLCLLLAVGVLPMVAFAAPKTVSNVEATYLNTATIDLMATGSIDDTYYQLDGGTVADGESVTTSLYGAHVLKFWSTDTSGNIEAAVDAPFFVDDSVVPEVEFEVSDTTATSAEVELTATDNFNGSGVDFLCYRVDGGKIMTAMAPAQLRAANVMLAKLADVKVTLAAGAPPINQGTPAPANHYGEVCSMCHVVNIPTPDPTTTPDPTGTPVPSGGVHADVVVTGAGSHTIEYWAQDVARNATTHEVKTFSIAGITATQVQLFAPSRYTVYHNRAIKFSGRLTPRMSGRVTLEIRKAGWRRYHALRTVTASGSGYFSYNYTVRSDRTPGTYYVHARYLGSDGFSSSVSAYKKFRLK